MNPFSLSSLPRRLSLPAWRRSIALVVTLLALGTGAQATQYAIIRADDYGSGSMSNASYQQFIQLVQTKGVVAGLGLICKTLENPPAGFITYTQGLNSGRFEIFNHGYEHTSSAIPNGGFEFGGQPYSYQLAEMNKAQDIVKQKLGITMRTFGAPNNEVDNNTSAVIASNPDLKVWFYVPGGVTVPSNVINVPRTNLEVKVNNVRIIDLATFKAQYDPNKPVICFQIHPGSLAGAEVTKVGDAIDFLKSKGVVFIKPYDYYLLLRGGGTVPGTPTSLTATRDTVNPTSQINLVWSNVANETGYQADHATSASGPWTSHNYIGSAPPAQPFPISGLNSGATYYFRVRAVNSGIYSAYFPATGGVSASTLAGGATNLAPDPGFETDPNVDYATNGTATYSWATDFFHGGSRSIKNVSTQPAGTLTRWFSRITEIAVTPGSSYTASAWFKTTSVTDHAVLTINYWNASQVVINSVSSTNLTGTANWTQKTVTSTAPANAAYIRVEFRLYGPGTLWADDVSVVKN